MEPELFKLPVSKEKQREYQSAILDGYRAMDKLVGRILKLVGDDAVVITGPPLSASNLVWTTKRRAAMAPIAPKEFSELMNFAGITSAHRVSPVMAEQFWIHFRE